MRTVLAAVGAALALGGLAHAQQQAQPGAMSDDDYMQQVAKAVPLQSSAQVARHRDARQVRQRSGTDLQ